VNEEEDGEDGAENNDKEEKCEEDENEDDVDWGVVGGCQYSEEQGKNNERTVLEPVCDAGADRRDKMPG
jgi:hypothetical protein